MLEDEDLDAATLLAANEAILELAGVVSGDKSDDQLTEQQVEASSKIRALAPGAWEFVKPVLQTLLTAAAKAKLGI